MGAGEGGLGRAKGV
jgi:hypothetical protein